MTEDSTTQDPVEAPRGSWGAVNRRDFDAAMTLYAPNAIWNASPSGVGVYEGPEAIRGFFEDGQGSYEVFQQAPEGVRDLGDGVSFSVARARRRLPGSGGFVEQRYAAVTTWADGLTERITLYTDFDEARAGAERLAEERG